MADAGDWYYMYDTVANCPVSSHAEHRSRLADMIKRSRFFLVNTASWHKGERTGGQQELGFRYFEGAAAGAVLIGDAPRNASFNEYFGWQDSVIPLPFDSGDIADVLAELGRRSEPPRADQQDQRGELPPTARPRVPVGPDSLHCGPEGDRRRWRTAGANWRSWRRRSSGPCQRPNERTHSYLIPRLDASEWRDAACSFRGHRIYRERCHTPPVGAWSEDRRSGCRPPSELDAECLRSIVAVGTLGDIQFFDSVRAGPARRRRAVGPGSTRPLRASASQRPSAGGGRGALCRSDRAGQVVRGVQTLQAPGRCDSPYARQLADDDGRRLKTDGAPEGMNPIRRFGCSIAEWTWFQSSPSTST